jgi:hypothetical protein
MGSDLRMVTSAGVQRSGAKDAAKRESRESHSEGVRVEAVAARERRKTES